jgi:hypothetical protein
VVKLLHPSIPLLLSRHLHLSKHLNLLRHLHLFKQPSLPKQRKRFLIGW